MAELGWCEGQDLPRAGPLLVFVHWEFPVSGINEGLTMSAFYSQQPGSTLRILYVAHKYIAVLFNKYMYIKFYVRQITVVIVPCTSIYTWIYVDKQCVYIDVYLGL